MEQHTKLQVPTHVVKECVQPPPNGACLASRYPGGRRAAELTAPLQPGRALEAAQDVVDGLSKDDLVAALVTDRRHESYATESRSWRQARRNALCLIVKHRTARYSLHSVYDTKRLIRGVLCVMVMYLDPGPQRAVSVLAGHAHIHSDQLRRGQRAAS